MTILYIGNFLHRHCTEVHLAATLEDLGHEVIRIQEDAYKPDQFASVLARNTFDLFLFTRTWGNTVTLEHLAHLRERKIPSVSYHLDLYIGLKREDGLDKDPFWRTDWVFTPDGDPLSQAVFENKRINHHYMKPGVYKPECYMAEKSDRDIDVLFVGGGDKPGSPYIYGHPEWDYRNQLIGWLYETYGERFTKYGHPQETIRNEALNQLYADTKVVVGDSLCLNFNHPYYWSDRLAETTGRGGFIIHPYIKGLEQCYVNRKEAVFYEYNNWKQLKYFINYYLRNDDEREAIRLAGHERTKRDHTYHNRLTEMFEVINGKD